MRYLARVIVGAPVILWVLLVWRPTTAVGWAAACLVYGFVLAVLDLVVDETGARPGRRR